MSIDRAGMKTQHFANIRKPALAPSCPPLTTPLWKAVLLGSSLYIHDETKQICVILNNNPLSMVICSEITVQNRKMRLEISLLKSNLYQIKRRRRRKKMQYTIPNALFWFNNIPTTMFLNSIDVKNVSLTYATKASLIKYIYLQLFAKVLSKIFPCSSHFLYQRWHLIV